jgi:signal peptidase I
MGIESLPHNVMSTLHTEENIENEGAEMHQPKRKHPLAEIIEFAFIALLIVIPVRMFIAQPFIVSGASMEDTFHSGEYLIIDQVSYHLEDPARGDVIVFRYPQDPSKFFIKRIIGIPGDTIDIQGNTVTITTKDGKTMTLDEPYIKSMAKNTTLTETLGDREYFVMGDNRDASSDSRVWGVLQKEKIIGKALVRLFPFNEAGLFPGIYDINNNN